MEDIEEIVYVQAGSGAGIEDIEEIVYVKAESGDGIQDIEEIVYVQAGAGEGGDETEEIDYPLFSLAEAIYMSWFTFELLIRLISLVSFYY